MALETLEKIKLEELSIDFPRLTIKESLDVLSSGLIGISQEDAEKRLKIYGPNALPKKKKKSRISIFLDNLSSPLIYALFGAAFFAGIIGKIADVFVIVVVVFINAFIGYFQEVKAEKDIESLKKLSQFHVDIIRNNKKIKIETELLVPGDIVILEEGVKVPADGRLIEANNLFIDESSLTGESELINKTDEKGDIKETETSKNMVYQGTTIAEGRGKFIVTASGENTRFGKIALYAQEPEAMTPIQKKMVKLSQSIGIAVLVMSLLVLLIGLLRGEDMIYMVQLSVSLAVSAIPEGLPIAITIILVLGAKRMAKRNAIVRNMMAVETLGTTTIIASDKTGTLTHNKLSAVEIFTDKIIIPGKEAYGLRGDFYLNNNKYTGNDLSRLLNAGAICSNAEAIETDGSIKIVGEPTDSAVLAVAIKNGFKKRYFRRLEEIPFSSSRRMMAVLAESSGEFIYMKGAPEEIIKRSESIFFEGKEKKFDDIMRKKIEKIVSDMSKKGLRIVAVAEKKLEDNNSRINKNIDGGFLFLGLIGMKDTYRPGVKEAIKKCQIAGIKIVMLTGDHLETALAIAKSLNIFKKGDRAMLAENVIRELDSNANKTFSNITVFARVLPEHKYKIIDAFKKENQIIAMTGDGVNDVPALRKADIGIAMGLNGTDAAKESADLVLADDDFATIVSAVEEGRTIFENIRKVVLYLISTSIGEVMTVFGSLILKIPLPITPLQILWINLITDTAATIPLGMELKEEEHLKKPPRDPDEGIISALIIRRSLLVGLYMTIVALTLFLLNLNKGIDYARTLAFLFLSISQWFNGFNCRSEKKSVFKINFFSNMALIYGILFGFFAQLAVMYIHPFYQIFGFERVGISEWIIAIVASFGIILLIEADKILTNYRNNKLKSIKAA